MPTPPTTGQHGPRDTAAGVGARSGEHWPTVGDPGLCCECGWTVTGVRLAEAKRRWWQHVKLEEALAAARAGGGERDE